MSFKQGTLAGSKQLDCGCWLLAFKRKEPLKAGKTPLWYVKLMKGESPPAIGELWRIPADRLKEVDKYKGNDCFEELPVPAKGDITHVDTKPLEQVPATPIEKIQLEKFELLGMYIAASFLVGNGRDETEGLKVGEVALLLLEDHAKLVAALKSEGFTKENIKKLIRI